MVSSILRRSLIYPRIKVKSLLIESLPGSDKFDKNASFLLNAETRFFKFDSDRLLVFDHLTLTLADKSNLVFQIEAKMEQLYNQFFFSPSDFGKSIA